MAPGSTQSLTGMSTRDTSWLIRRPVRRADNLTTFMCRLSRNSDSLNLRGVQACNGIEFCLSSGNINCIHLTEDRNLCCALANTILILELNTVMDLLVEPFI